MKRHTYNREATTQKLITADVQHTTAQALVIDPVVGMKVTLPATWAICEGNKKPYRNGTIIRVYPTYFLVEWDETKLKEGFCYVSTENARRAKALHG